MAYHPKAYCFDDLGVEVSQKYFGTEYNVMAEILLTRYELFINQRMITHITTHLTGDEIEKRYGDRIRSRMREMMNPICFLPGDKRK
ncbi:P-loop NTPase family protein [Pararhodonellum marinum]|uniref:hypothetical protein n=1 Tax=Pararhodonellum marinum TaxID=2755358 RepID=UPI00188FA9C8|nr:hypothetical protein [Pararhodonellum marinum]